MEGERVGVLGASRGWEDLDLKRNDLRRAGEAARITIIAVESIGRSVQVIVIIKEYLLRLRKLSLSIVVVNRKS